MLIDMCQYLVESVEIVVSWLLVDDPRLFKEIVVDMTTHGVALAFVRWIKFILKLQHYVCGKMVELT